MTRPCPWCKQPYDRFVPHDDVDTGSEPLPLDACESELGFWIHGEAVA